MSGISYEADLNVFESEDGITIDYQGARVTVPRKELRALFNWILDCMLAPPRESREAFLPNDEVCPF